MPIMFRPNKQTTAIAYSILGTPSNMPYKRYKPIKNTNVKEQVDILNRQKLTQTGMMGGGYL